MTNINFYVTKQNGLEYRLAIVSKLIHHALKRNLFIHIHTDNENMNKQIDDWLWIFDKNSFLPHCIVSQSDKNNPNRHPKETITISHDFEPMDNCDYLINLSLQRPGFFSRFTKVAEILDNSDEILSAGRKRYAFYKERGYTLAYHKL